MTIPELYAAYQNHPKLSIDTRKDAKNTIFFCLKGPNFDANTFAKQALKDGAALVVSDDEKNAGHERIAIVDDVLSTLQNLANYHRKQFQFPVIGLTGSNGKTTNKELIFKVLSMKFKTFATRGNFNNHIGVPLTLLEIPLTAEMAIIEMGANHQGEIRDLSNIAEPNYGLITNIGKAHLEGFGGIEGVKKGKKELFDFLQPKKGLTFVNADDEVMMELSRHNERILFGSRNEGLIKGTLLSTSPNVIFQFEDGTANPVKIISNMIGEYNYYNLLASACIGRYFGVDYDDIKRALESYVPQNNRSQILKTDRNKILLDAYNANPTSMEAALRNLATIDATPKLAILGHMMELGETTQAEHQSLIELIFELKLDAILVGSYFEGCKQHGMPYFKNTEQAEAFLKSNPLKDHLVLLKGSRAVAMEKLVPYL